MQMHTDIFGGDGPVLPNISKKFIAEMINSFCKYLKCDRSVPYTGKCKQTHFVLIIPLEAKEDFHALLTEWTVETLLPFSQHTACLSGFSWHL